MFGRKWGARRFYLRAESILAFINDIPELLNSNCLLYADDLNPRPAGPLDFPPPAGGGGGRLNAPP